MAEAKTYYQAAEPTDQTPGTIWIAENGDRKQRGTDAVWRNCGNVNLDNGGSVKRSGDSMDGALGGAHGLAPLDSPACTTGITIDNLPVATQQWVQDLIEGETGLHAAITEQIRIATDGADPTFDAFNYIAFGYGSVSHNEAIPMPRYKLGSGETAGLSEIVLLTVSCGDIVCQYGVGDYAFEQKFSVDNTTGLVTSQLVVPDHWCYTGTANYSIICAKNPS